MIEIIPLVILALASYRLTRFLVIDTLIAGMRNKFHGFLINKAQKQGKIHLLWEKLYDLSSCTWCAGFWVSAGLYWAYTTTPLGIWTIYIIDALAIAGVQGMLHALEPGDE